MWTYHSVQDLGDKMYRTMIPSLHFSCRKNEMWSFIKPHKCKVMTKIKANV